MIGKEITTANNKRKSRKKKGKKRKTQIFGDRVILKETPHS